jgi:hypothetical protein
MPTVEQSIEGNWEKCGLVSYECRKVRLALAWMIVRKDRDVVVTLPKGMRDLTVSDSVVVKRDREDIAYAKPCHQ